MEDRGEHAVGDIRLDKLEKWAVEGVIDEALLSRQRLGGACLYERLVIRERDSRRRVTLRRVLVPRRLNALIRAGDTLRLRLIVAAGAVKTVYAIGRETAPTLARDVAGVRRELLLEMEHMFALSVLGVLIVASLVGFRDYAASAAGFLLYAYAESMLIARMRIDCGALCDERGLCILSGQEKGDCS